MSEPNKSAAFKVIANEEYDDFRVKCNKLNAINQSRRYREKGLIEL